MDTQLLEYIRTCKKNGLNDEQIKSELLKQGWKQDQIDEAFTKIAKNFEKVPFTDVFTFAWRLVAQYWKPLLVICLISFILSYIVNLCTQYYLPFKTNSSSEVDNMKNLILAGDSARVSYNIFSTVMMMVIGFFLQSIIGMVSMLSYLLIIRDGIKKVDLGRLISESLDYIIPYSWASILYSLICVLGFLLFIIPGFYFSVIYSFYGYALVFDNLRGYNALKRSKDLVTKHHPFHVFILLLFGAVISAFIPYVGGVFGVLYAFSIYSYLKAKEDGAAAWP